MKKKWKTGLELVSIANGAINGMNLSCFGFQIDSVELLDVFTVFYQFKNIASLYIPAFCSNKLENVANDVRAYCTTYAVCANVITSRGAK